MQKSVPSIIIDLFNTYRGGSCISASFIEFIKEVEENEIKCEAL